jgi:protein-tyrosine-phosphatase
MNILFVCRHNIFRSRIAEEHMKKISNGKHNISSAGLIRFHGEMEPLQKKVCEERGFILPNQSKSLSVEGLRNQDLVVIVANDVPPKLLEHKGYHTIGKVRRWNISDVETNDYTREEVENIIQSIVDKVEKLNNELEN